jgi:hypothetical protein
MHRGGTLGEWYTADLRGGTWVPRMSQREFESTTKEYEEMRESTT